MAPIKKFSVKTVGSDKPIEVTLGFAYTHFFLVLPHQPDVESDDVLETARVTTTLNSVSHSLSFVPPNTQTGARRFFMKTYTENEGLLEQLMDLKILKKTGIQIEGLPVVEVQLEESELAHACAYHYDQQGLVDARFELAEPGEGKEVVRYQRCSKCKEMYYCSQECQVKHWETHKSECKAWKKSPSEGARLMENRRRAGVESMFSQMGVKNLDLTENMVKE